MVGPIVRANSISGLCDQMACMTINEEDVTAARESMGIVSNNNSFRALFFERVPGADCVALLQTCKAVYKVFSNANLWRRIFDREGLLYSDEEKCRKYRGEPGEVPPLSWSKAYQYFHRPCPLTRSKRVLETHKLQLFCKEIDGISTTLNRVGELAKSPKAGSGGITACFHRHALPEAFQVFGEEPLGRSYWAFVALKPLDGSIGIRVAEKLRLVDKLSHYRLHRIVERSIANFDNVVETGEYLDGCTKRSITNFDNVVENDVQYSWTICKDTIRFNEGSNIRFDRLAVGAGSTQDGLSFNDCSAFYFSLYCGAIVLREFS